MKGLEKHFFRYVLYFVITVIVTGGIAFFVPPIIARCDCTFNTLKSGLAFPGSFIEALAVIYLINRKVLDGEPSSRYFLVYLVMIAAIQVLLGVLNMFFFA